MRRICAWCQAALDAGDGPGDRVISHGICPACADDLVADDGSLRSLLDRLGVPVLVLDADGTLVTANHQACRVLGRDESTMVGMTGGDAMRCKNAKLPGGCGHTVHCHSCTIRQTVLATRRTGRGLERVRAVQDQELPEGPRRVEYHITTEQLGPLVLLRIDDGKVLDPEPLSER